MFDLLVLTVVGLSTVFAALRGGLRELSTLLALAIAGGLTLLLIEPILGITGQAGSFFGTAIIAVVLIAIFFVLAHIVLHLGLKRMQLEGNAKLYDRISGGTFGLFRGLVLIGLGYLGYTYYLDESRHPEEVKNAFTRPVAAGMAHWFESFAPEEAYIESPAIEEEEEDEPDPALSGYDRSDRNSLSEIVTTVTTTDPALDETPDATDKVNAGDVDELTTDAITDILIEEEPQ